MKKTYQVYFSADLQKVETSFGFFQIKCSYKKTASDVKLYIYKKNIELDKPPLPYNTLFHLFLNLLFPYLVQD